MHRLHTLTVATLLALTVAACGDKEINTTPASSTHPRTATDATQQPSSPPSETPKTATVGDTLNLSGTEGGETVAVTVVKVVDPAPPENEFSSPDAAKRFVAVQFRLKNIGTKVFSDSPDNGAKVRDAQGQQFGSTVEGTAAGPDFGGSVTITPGDTALGFIVFQVPRSSKITQVQFALDSGYARDVGQWTVS